MSVQPVLICIPDISGFTKFMSEAEFELTSKVIPALLNNIIYANEIGLKVSEIEGDAVLFYKTGKMPTIKALVAQCKQFYIDFYEQLEILREKNSHMESAEKIPEILGLKIILHYGKEVGLVQIDKRIKLMGEDVITAHRLLKNDIPIDEYVLLSDQVMANYKEEHIDDGFDWATLKDSHIEVEHIGKVHFKYIDLTPVV